MDFNNKIEDMLLKLAPMLRNCSWLMRVTDNSKTGVTLQIWEIQKEENGKTSNKKYGEITGSKLRSCISPIRYILADILDENSNSVGLHHLLDGGISYRGDIPLDKAVGVKLALIAILIKAINYDAKCELIAWRIERVSVEEALYWFGKVTVPVYGERAMQWAIIGMRTMLAGPTDQKVNYEEMLERLRR